MTPNYWPFRRVFIDHLFHGLTRVWWELNATFNDPQPHSFQLQAGYTGNGDALDWINIGDPQINAFYLDDASMREETGKRLLTHYRIVLTTPRKTYISDPYGVFGNLVAHDWRIAQEIVRKEHLRMGNVSQPGYLLKRMRHGQLNPANTDRLTDEIINSSAASSWGTAYKIGYHPAVPFEIDMSPVNIQERRGGADISQNDTRPTAVQGRVIGGPEMAKEDVWVHGTSDQRWSVDDIAVEVAFRGVPLIYNVKFNLIPYSDITYSIPVSRLSDDLTVTQPFQAVTGNGCIRIDHNYGGIDALAYRTECCDGITGATVTAFRKTVWDSNHRTPADAIASVQTTDNGYWAKAMLLDPGNYVLQFEKLGSYGPDVHQLTVAAAPSLPPPRPTRKSFKIGGVLPSADLTNPVT